MAGWHHRLDGHEFEQALGVGDGQGSLACCSPWGCKESCTTERLNRTERRTSNNIYFRIVTVTSLLTSYSSQKLGFIAFAFCIWASLGGSGSKESAYT